MKWSNLVLVSSAYQLVAAGSSGEPVSCRHTSCSTAALPHSHTSMSPATSVCTLSLHMYTLWPVQALVRGQMKLLAPPHAQRVHLRYMISSWAGGHRTSHSSSGLLGWHRGMTREKIERISLLHRHTMEPGKLCSVLEVLLVVLLAGKQRR